MLNILLVFCIFLYTAGSIWVFYVLQSRSFKSIVLMLGWLFIGFIALRDNLAYSLFLALLLPCCHAFCAPIFENSSQKDSLLQKAGHSLFTAFCVFLSLLVLAFLGSFIRGRLDGLGVSDSSLIAFAIVLLGFICLVGTKLFKHNGIGFFLYVLVLGGIMVMSYQYSLISGAWHKNEQAFVAGEGEIDLVLDTARTQPIPLGPQRAGHDQWWYISPAKFLMGGRARLVATREDGPRQISQDVPVWPLLGSLGRFSDYQCGIPSLDVVSFCPLSSGTYTVVIEYYLGQDRYPIVGYVPYGLYARSQGYSVTLGDK